MQLTGVADGGRRSFLFSFTDAGLEAAWQGDGASCCKESINAEEAGEGVRVWWEDFALSVGFSLDTETLLLFVYNLWICFSHDRCQVSRIGHDSRKI